MDAFSCSDSYMEIQAVDGRSESEPSFWCHRVINLYASRQSVSA